MTTFLSQSHYQSLATENLSSLPRWLTNKAIWSLFYNPTSATSFPPDSSNLSEALDSLTNFIISVTESTVPRWSGIHKPNQVPWWSEGIHSTIKARKKFSRSLTHYFIAHKRAHAKVKILVHFAIRNSSGAHLSLA